MVTSAKCVWDEPLLPSGSRTSDTKKKYLQAAYSVGQFKTFLCAEAKTPTLSGSRCKIYLPLFLYITEKITATSIILYIFYYIYINV